MKRFLSWVLVLLLIAMPALAAEVSDGMLYRGIKGHQEEVEFLQYQLFYAGYLGDDIDEVDGIFGKKTEDALKAYQLDHGFTPDGILWPDVKAQLDAEWESGMEPQGGETEPYPYCYVEHYANGTQSVVLCRHHMDVYAMAAAEMKELQANGMQTLEGMQAGVSVWLDELDALYENWTILSSEHAQLISNHQEAFTDYYRAQMALWHAHFGTPSVEALERAQNMLAEQCSNLCIALSGAF